jgi:FdhE protein
MVASATVRIMSAEEIAAQSIGDAPLLRLPDVSTVFAERQMRLSQLARGHAMEAYMTLMAAVAGAQQTLVAKFVDVDIPAPSTLAVARAHGMSALPAATWSRHSVWQSMLRELVALVRPAAPDSAYATLDALSVADSEFLEAQADALLGATKASFDMAAAPFIAAALQVYWTRMAAAVGASPAASADPFPRTNDDTVCPCCGSVPTASVTRATGGTQGHRYLHCALCNCEWHMVRIRCPRCASSKSLAYHALDASTAETDADGAAARAALASIQAETCDECNHYLKIMHTDRDPLIEPVADDLATVTLDLLVADEGKRRHGRNLMLLFDESAIAPPDPGAP